MPVTDPNRTVVREYPVVMWLIGGGLLALAAYVSTASGGWIPAIIIAVAAIVLALLGKVTSVTVDRSEGLLTLRKRNAFTGSRREIRLADIKKVSVESVPVKSRRGDWTKNYRVVFVLNSDEIVRLQDALGDGYLDYVKKAWRYADIIGVPGPGERNRTQPK